MDDGVVLARTRWRLRAAVRSVNQTVTALKVRQHTGRTIVGRVSRGFVLLGYRFSSPGLVGVAVQTILRCAPADEPAL
jgi:hypothetical protein